MLYLALQKKSMSIESELIAGKRNDAEIYNFISSIIESIPKIQNPQNYNSTLELLQKWQTIYFDFFNKVHPGLNEYRFVEKKLSTKLVSDHALSYLLLGHPSKSFDKTIKQLLDIDPIQKIDVPPKKILGKEKKLLSTITNEYKSSNLKELAKDISEAINNKASDAQPTAEDAVYVSWILHMLGNVFNVTENSHQSEIFYHQSLSLKEKIINNLDEFPELPEGFLYYSYFSTKLKYSFSKSNNNSFSFGVHIDELLAIRENIEEKKYIIDVVNDRYYKSLINVLEYYLAKMYFYSGSDVKSLEYFNLNLKNTSLIGDNPGRLRAYIHKMAANDLFGSTTKVFFSDIASTLSCFSKYERESPITKALIGEKHLLEYNVLLGSNDFSQNLYNTFSHFGIEPHAKLVLLR